jgi:hypothetical protein
MTCLLIVLCIWSFCCANEEEPVLGHKELILDRLDHCISMADHQLGNVIKPAHSTSVGMGVDHETGLGLETSPNQMSYSQNEYIPKRYTKEKCEEMYNVPCMSQPYHPGPWEVRLYKSGSWISSAVVWKVPCQPPQCTEPYPFLTRFPWQSKVEACINSALPLSSFLSVDIRTTGEDVRVLEINGVFGMPYNWAATNDSTYSVIHDHAQWILERIRAGANQLSLLRLLELVQLGVERHFMTRGPSKIWF